ncbi:hypothetical protein AVEN_187334-1 [Araneus ventricosus]|uniref:Uncharacterized protein n=1 Tax=Araneus ventricosus TaxID=182803 RepID=A0A4Y2HZA7_ARAVE|nr:hypothetical protein AVEN_187334-1 [Araneus ventricosus]
MEEYASKDTNIISMNQKRKEKDRLNLPLQEQNNNFQRNNSSGKSDTNPTEAQTIDRRQDEGFDFMKYFVGRGQQEDEEPAQQQLHQVQQPLSVQQQHQLQQQILKEQQRRQQEQLLQLQRQQLVTLQQQQPAVAYQVPLSRDGGYGGGISIGNGYAGAQPKDFAISIGGGKPIFQIGNIFKILPRIINVLSAGGKVMFGVELGNNFYFGPVGAKPLVKAG